MVEIVECIESDSSQRLADGHLSRDSVNGKSLPAIRIN